MKWFKNKSKKENPVTIVTWETNDSRCMNILFSPSHVLRIKVDKKITKNYANRLTSRFNR